MKGVLAVFLAFIGGLLTMGSALGESDEELALRIGRALSSRPEDEQKMTEYAKRDLATNDLKKLDWWWSRLTNNGKYVEAVTIVQRQLVIVERLYGSDHAEVGTTLNKLAVLYARQDRYAEAEPLYKRSIAITEKALGPDHPNLRTVLKNLAALYEAQGRHAESESVKKRALAITEKAQEIPPPGKP